MNKEECKIKWLEMTSTDKETEEKEKEGSDHGEID